MTREVWFNALCYEVGLWAVERRPSLAFSPWFKLLMKHCRPDWMEWKTAAVMKKVDKQASTLQEQWKKEEREAKTTALAKKAQELFPDAKVTAAPDAVVPSVIIEKAPPEGASDAVKALGGELRITYQLDQAKLD